MNTWSITVTGETMAEIREAAEDEYRRFFGHTPMSTRLQYVIVGTTETITTRDGGGVCFHTQTQIEYTADVTADVTAVSNV